MLYSDFLLKIKEFKKDGARIAYVCAENDFNGNPQRLYYDLKNHKCYDEGYMGYHAVPEHLRKEAYEAEYNCKLNVTEELYAELLTLDDIVDVVFN
tara:strand:- start:52 stop:339 length:288 start_codon:yes stop_codon:yes gene_type:complete